jgi:hypothetical protein
MKVKNMPHFCCNEMGFFMDQKEIGLVYIDK